MQPALECKRENGEHARYCGGLEYVRFEYAECLTERPRVGLNYDAVELWG